MKREQIKVGAWYETAQGVGECLRAGGCHPWAALVRIVGPIPRGQRWLTPREFIKERADILVACKAALGRFPAGEDAFETEVSPVRDEIMMMACDFGGLCEGTPIHSASPLRWRWTLTPRGKEARAQKA